MTRFGDREENNLGKEEKRGSTRKREATGKKERDQATTIRGLGGGGGNKPVRGCNDYALKHNKPDGGKRKPDTKEESACTGDL